MDISEIKLLPCAHCNSSATVLDNMDGCYVECNDSDCGIKIGEDNWTTHAALKIWNARHDNNALSINKCIEYLKENKPKMSSEQFKDLIRVTGGRIN